MNTLVTGGAGFIGSHVARYCVGLGQKVTVLDDLSGGFRDQIPEGAEFIQGSIVDNGLISEIFKTHKFNYVYHLAAYAAEGLSHFIRRFNYNNNLIGSINLINEAIRHEIKCFIFTSSIAVYGAAQLPMDESMNPQPEDPYGISKHAVERDLKAARELFGLNYIIFRPHNVYGEHQNIGDQYRNVIGIFMNQIMNQQPLTIFGDGSQTRAFSYIDDVAYPIAHCVKIPDAYNEIFNIGADKPYSVNHLAKIVCSEFGMEPNIQYLPARNEVKHAFSSHTKSKRILAAESHISLEEGIHRMGIWAKKVGARQSKKFSNIEINKNLPSSWI